MVKHSTSSSLSHESLHRFCYKQPFVAAHATSDFSGGSPFEAYPEHLIPSKQPECGRFFVAAPKRTIPQHRKHNIHRFGIYSSRARAYRAKTNLAPSTCTNEGPLPEQINFSFSPRKRAALRKRWAHLIRRVYLSYGRDVSGFCVSWAW
jgi:hypothetical protein